MTLPSLATMLVGSYAPPSWLVDVSFLRGSLPQRVPTSDLWRVDREDWREAVDDATIAVAVEQRSLGLDVITDGEIRRHSYSERFANALAGIDRERPGTTVSRTGAVVAVPRVAGPIERREPVEVDVAELVLSHVAAPLKVTLPGPFTMAQLCDDEYYRDEAELAMAFARAVNAEMSDLFAAGVTMVQIDEPYLQARPDRAHDYALEAISLALEGATGRTVLHSCFGYGQYVKDKPSGYPFFAELANCAADDISIEAAQPNLDLECLTELSDKGVQLGVLDCESHDIESPEAIADRVAEALEHVPASRLALSPDCGMKYLPREVAMAKLRAMVGVAEQMRDAGA